MCMCIYKYIYYVYIHPHVTRARARYCRVHARVLVISSSIKRTVSCATW